MSNEDVKFSVGAEDTGVAAVLAHVQEGVAESVDLMKEKIESLNATFEKVQGAFVAFTAVLAGGEAFKEMIASSVDLVKESGLLGRQFGISATDASVLKVALGGVFVTQDQMAAGAAKITIALKKNESAFTDLGVATRDQNGDFRSTIDIMQDTNERLMEFKEGTDRNVEGTKIYGKAWQEVAPTLRVTKEVMEEARLKASELGLVVGQEGVAQTKAYRTAMNDVHEVMEGVAVVIGNALLPALTSMGAWMAENGTAIINGFKAAIYSVEAAFSYFKEGVVIATDFIAGSIDILGARFSRFGATANRALHADFSGAKAAWAEGTKNIEAASRQMAESIDHDMKDATKSREQFFDQMQGSQTAIEKPKTGEKSEGGDDKLKSQMAAYQAELAAAKEHFEESEALEGHFVEFSKQQEIDFWESKLKVATKGSGDYMHVQENIDKLLYEQRKAGYEAELSDIKAQESKYKNNLQAKLALAVEYANKIAAAEGGDSSKARAAQADVLAIDREIDAQKLELAKISQTAQDTLTLSGIDVEEKISQAKLANHQITDQQLLAMERQYEAQRLAIKMNGVQADLAIAQQNPEENIKLIAQINAQKLALMAQYNQKLAAINLKAADDSAKDWKKTFSALGSGFNTVITGMLQGTETFQAAIGTMYKTITGILANVVTDMATRWIETEVTKLLASKTTASQQVADNAAAAGSGAIAATAAIPYVGPELAPAAGAAAYAAALSFGAGLSAEGGYDIPAGINPVVQTHQKEMILPQEHADTIRGLKNAGAGDGMKSAIATRKEARGNANRIVKEIRKSTGRFA